MITIFEKYKSDVKLKAGDYVYPKPQYCGKFNILKPIRYKISRVFNTYNEEYCSLDNSEIIEAFPITYFTKETRKQKLENELQKYNL
jgi:hypothetical protein